jgi:hypothetical protein
MLQKYKEAPLQNWRDKDTALYLVTSLASKGQTQRHGTTQTNQLVDLNSFTTEHVLPELQKDAGMYIRNYVIVQSVSKMSFTALKACINLFRGHVQCFELS